MMTIEYLAFEYTAFEHMIFEHGTRYRNTYMYCSFFEKKYVCIQMYC